MFMNKFDSSYQQYFINIFDLILNKHSFRVNHIRNLQNLYLTTDIVKKPVPECLQIYWNHFISQNMRALIQLYKIKVKELFLILHRPSQLNLPIGFQQGLFSFISEQSGEQYLSKNYKRLFHKKNDKKNILCHEKLSFAYASSHLMLKSVCNQKNLARVQEQNVRTRGESLFHQNISWSALQAALDKKAEI